MSTPPASATGTTGSDTGTAALSKEVRAEAGRRRTFAVISHPDAGKSTLTEALALHAKVISEAGAVHGKAGRKSTVSDWMEMEKARGISVSSTALQFNYRSSESTADEDDPATSSTSSTPPRPLGFLRGHLPGPDRRRRRGDAHRRREGSRAADPQAVPGVPPPRDSGDHRDQQMGPAGPRTARTARRDRRTNRPDADPPLFWPVGIAGDFRGLLRRGEDGAAEEYIKFTRTAGGAKIAPPEEHLTSDDALDREGDTWAEAAEESELLSASGQDHDQELFLAGQTSP